MKRSVDKIRGLLSLWLLDMAVKVVPSGYQRDILALYLAGYLMELVKEELKKAGWNEDK